MALLATPVKTERNMTRQLPGPKREESSSPVEQALNLVRILAENAAMGLGADAEFEQEPAAEGALRQAISEADLSSRLRAAVESAAVKNSGSMEALRIAVCAFTIALRDEGITPEAVLIRLKEAIRQETFRPLWLTSTWGGPRLDETITTWCIEDYFREKHCTV